MHRVVLEADGRGKIGLVVTSLPAMLVIALGVDSYQALIVSQVLLSIQLPFTIVPLLWLSRSRRVMGDERMGPVQTATGKAWTAVSFRTETTELAALTQAGRPASGVRALPGVIAVGGGMMIRAKGVLLGGIGVSGAPGGDQDDVCAKSGLAAIVDAIELE